MSYYTLYVCEKQLFWSNTSNLDVLLNKYFVWNPKKKMSFFIEEAPDLLAQYPVRREGIRPNAPSVLIGSKQSVLGHKRCNPDDFETITLKGLVENSLRYENRRAREPLLIDILIYVCFFSKMK